MSYPYTNPESDFANHVKPYSELSLPDNNDKRFDPLFSSQMPTVDGIDLDTIAQDEFTTYSGCPLRSCDALHFGKDNNYYLVEFKNQRSGNIKGNEIHKKIIDSLSLILYLFSPTDSIHTLHNRVRVYVVFPDQDAFLKIAKTVGNSGSTKMPIKLKRPLWDLGKLVQDEFIGYADTMTLSEFKTEVTNWPAMALPKVPTVGAELRAIRV